MLVRAFFLLLLISSNASHAGLFGDDKAREQINVLRQQVEELEARIAQMEETLKSQALLELYAQVETLGLELGKLRGQIEVLSNDNTALQKRQRDFYIDLDNRLRQIEQPGAPLPVYSDPSDSADPAGITNGSSTTEQPDQDTEASQSQLNAPETTFTHVAAIPSHTLQPANSAEQDFYNTAYRQFTDGDYAGAKTQFENFLNLYPHSSLAPSAAYWIGNAHYALREFQNAIEAQKSLMKRYPDSPKVPDAMLNIASSQNEMDNRKIAKETLEDLVTQYPFSDAAEKAKQRLAHF